jgi:hypothetical protein
VRDAGGESMGLLERRRILHRGRVEQHQVGRITRLYQPSIREPEVLRRE